MKTRVLLAISPHIGEIQVLRSTQLSQSNSKEFKGIQSNSKEIETPFCWAKSRRQLELKWFSGKTKDQTESTETPSAIRTAPNGASFLLELGPGLSYALGIR
jgi:hypothetical protein